MAYEKTIWFVCLGQSKKLQPISSNHSTKYSIFPAHRSAHSLHSHFSPWFFEFPGLPSRRFTVIRAKNWRCVYSGLDSVGNSSVNELETTASWWVSPFFALCQLINQSINLSSDQTCNNPAIFHGFESRVFSLEWIVSWFAGKLFTDMDSENRRGGGDFESYDRRQLHRDSRTPEPKSRREFVTHGTETGMWS